MYRDLRAVSSGSRIRVVTVVPGRHVSYLLMMLRRLQGGAGLESLPGTTVIYAQLSP